MIRIPLAAVLIAASGTTADVLNVPGDFPTIQEAIDAAVDGDEVLVAPGAYAEALDMLGKAITLRGAEGPDETILDGALIADNILRAESGETLDTVVEGFSFVNAVGGSSFSCAGFGINGSAIFVGGVSELTIHDCRFEGNGHDVGAVGGGAIAAVDGGLRITDSVFVDNGGFVSDFDNGAAYGGAVYMCNFTFEFDLTIENCVFDGNGPTSHGGAVWVDTAGNVDIRDSDFFGNAAAFGGGINAAARNNKFGNPVGVRIEGCSFTGNSAGFGGGVFGQVGFDSGLPDVKPEFEIVDCQFTDNLADETCCDTGIYVSPCWQDGINFGTFFGGGADVRVTAGTARIVNSLFAGNEAVDAAGLHVSTCGEPDFDVFGGTVEVTNCTIADNTGEGLRIRVGSTGDVAASNLIVRGNTADQILTEIQDPVDGEVKLSVAYSNVEGGFDGPGNIDAPAGFVGDGDYRLAAASPGIDAGDSAALPEGVETDLDGNPRFVDDPDTDDTGVGPHPIVDMGPYEFQAGACAADFNGDGELNVLDFVDFQAAWLAQDPAADCDANAEFNVLDFVCYQGLFSKGCP